MNMKKLIESMDHIEECGMAEGPMGMAPPAPEDKGNPVTVNVSMNASGKEHVADLLDMMKNAGLGDAGPAADKMMSPRMDMERLAGIMDDPKIPGKDDVPGDADVDDSSCMDDIDTDVDEGAAKNAMMDDAETMDKEDFCAKYMAMGMDKAECEEQWSQMNEADYANEPDAQYGDMSDAIPDGNDLNRKKKAYAATQDGDNPMAVENIKAALYAALTEKKKTMVKGPDGKMVPDYAADGKGKDDLSKGKKDTKTAEGRGKVMAGRGKVMAGRGRGKDKLMAGRGRGKKK